MRRHRDTIENYPGHPQIDGSDLMLKMREQVDALNVSIAQRMWRICGEGAVCWEVKAGEEWYQG